MVKIAGTVTATRVQLREAAPVLRPTQAPDAGKPPAAAGPALLAFDRLQIVMDEVRPLEQFVKLSSVELTAPRLSVERDRTGRLNLLPPAVAVAIKNIADHASKSGAAGQKCLKDAVPVAPPVPAAAAQPIQPWKVIIARLAVRDGKVTAPQLALRDVKLAQGKTSLVSVKRLQIEGAELDVPGQSFKAKRLTLTEPKALVARDASKRWMFERWRVERSAPQAVVATATATDAVATGKPPAPSWAIAINQVLVEGGTLSFSDKSAGKPVAFDVSALNAQRQRLVLDNRHPGTSAGRAARTMPITVSLRLASGRFEPGKLDFKGSVGLAPVRAQGQLAVSRLPVQAFESYFAEAVNIDLLGTDASFKGRVA